MQITVRNVPDEVAAKLDKQIGGSRENFLREAIAQIAEMGLVTLSQVEEEIQERGGAGIVERDLQRYYALLSHELGRVSLTRNEACLICDALNRTLTDMRVNPKSVLYAEIADSIELERTDQKWEVDASAILAKIQAMTIAQAAAIVDAAERFWHEPDSYTISDIDEKLLKAGLVKKQ